MNLVHEYKIYPPSKKALSPLFPHFANSYYFRA